MRKVSVIWSIDDLAAAFLANRHGRGNVPSTLRDYRRSLDQFSSWYTDTLGRAPNAASITTIDGADYRGWLASRSKPATANLRLTVLRMAFRWAVEEGFLARNPFRDIQLVPEPPVAPRSVAQSVLRILIQHAQEAGNVRDVAILTLLAQTGLRVSEAMGLTWHDVMFGEGAGAITVKRGKGGKWREVPATQTVQRALLTWRDARWQGALPEMGNPVFPGRSEGRALTVRAVEKIIGRYTEAAGMMFPLTPHTFRHAFCKTLVDAGTSLDRVAVLAGHSSLQITARYTLPTRVDLERAVEHVEWV